MRLQTETMISKFKETLATHPPDVHNYNNLQLWKVELLTNFDYKYLEFNQYFTNENKINLVIIKFDRYRVVCAYIFPLFLDISGSVAAICRADAVYCGIESA